MVRISQWIGVHGVRAATTLLAAAVAGSVLGGCIALAGGAAIGGAVVATDRRSVGIQIEDQGIERRINRGLETRFARESVHIDVFSFNQRVLLTGQVPQERDRAAAESIAREAQGVHEVINELTIGFMAGLGNNTDDLVLAGKVRAELLGAKGLPAGSIKVTVALGDVYLMGRVGSTEADLAKRVVSHVNGVKRVVALFELLTDAELDKLLHGSSAPVVEAPATGR
jgi:osmotically-inducible protein OsmY